LRFVSIIIIYNFVVTDIILSGQGIRIVYAQDFDAALKDGNNIGYDSSFNFNPFSLNNTLNNKGLGSSTDITPRMNEALSQKDKYTTYYSDTASMGEADKDKEAYNYVTTSSQSRPSLDLTKDEIYGNQCLERNADNSCWRWSSSSDLIGNAYPDCNQIIIPEYEPEPTYETCAEAKTISATSCNVRTFANIQTETVHTPCDQITIEYQPGQIYAVCKDYYDYFRVPLADERTLNDCDCGNVPGALCGANIPTYFYGPPLPGGGLRFMGLSAENFYDRSELDGWDYCSFQRFNYYSKYNQSVIERVIFQYDSPCGEMLSQYGQNPECTIQNFEQCDTGGLKCSVIVQNGVGTGVDPAADPRACDNFSGSIENYRICLNYSSTSLNGKVLSNTPQTETATTSEYGNTINWTRIYGGADIKPLFNFWYSKADFRCNTSDGNCQPLIDKGCKLFEHKCTDLDCNNYEYTYRCGGTGALKNVHRGYTCVSDIKCMGSECKDTNYTANQDFSSAAAATEVLNQYRVDTNGIEIFPGEEQMCMINPKDCCKHPDGGMSVGDYINLGRAAIDAYSMLSEGTAATWVNYADSLTYVTSLGESGTLNGLVGVDVLPGESISVIADQELVTEAGSELLTQKFGMAQYQSAGNTVFSGASQVVSALSTIATVATIAYLIYTIGSYVYNWIYQCEEDDITTSQKEGMRLCHEVGRRCESEAVGICLKQRVVYCCFNSILARVLHEQARPQINKPWGDPEAPICEGFTPGELASIDFSRIDLSEYMQYVKYNLSIPPEKYQQIVDKTRNTINDSYNENQQNP